MRVTFDTNSFAEQYSKEILSLIKEAIWEFSPPNSDEEKITRLSNLKNHVLDGLDDNVKKEVEKVWDEWLINGFGLNYKP